ncbi:MAG: hypothetical protein ACR2OR_09340 [Hyphomicrobiales bacterium]
MDLLPLSVVLILIGIPALIGAFNVCANIGKESVRNGVGVLIYAGALAAGFAIVLPQGTIAQGNYLLKSPGAFVVCALIGGSAGLISRFFSK